MLKSCYKLALSFFMLFAGTLAANESFVGHRLSSPNDTYTLVKLLGQGAYGLTYAGYNAKGNSVAIKVFRLKFSPTNDTVWPSLQKKNPKPFDGKALAQEEWDKGHLFDSPHILQFLDRGSFVDDKGNERYFIIMELIRGETLVKELDGTLPSTLSVEKAKDIIQQLLETLRLSLPQDYYYWDLHAGNVMIAEGNLFKILDIGGFIPLLHQSEISIEKAKEVQTMNSYLKMVFLLIKRILQKSPYTPEEYTSLSTALKSHVDTVGDKRMFKENVPDLQHVLEQWRGLFVN